MEEPLKAIAISCLKASPFAAKHPALKKWSSVSEGAARQPPTAGAAPTRVPVPTVADEGGQREQREQSSLSSSQVSLKHFKSASQVKARSLPILCKRRRVRIILAKPLPEFSSIVSHSSPAAAYPNAHTCLSPPLASAQNG